jgi:hypothetical protein
MRWRVRLLLPAWQWLDNPPLYNSAEIETPARTVEDAEESCPRFLGCLRRTGATMRVV